MPTVDPAQGNLFTEMDWFVVKSATVGEGAVVGTGIVVTQDVPLPIVMAGNLTPVVREV